MDNLEHQLKQVLQKYEQLKQENKQLKAILQSHNIPFPSSSTILSNDVAQTKSQKIHERIQIFKKLFSGRTDIYAKRYETKVGKSGYTPACKYEWQKPICQKPTIKCSDCSQRTLLPLTGKYIGEGFDHAKLDTLFLTMPISWKGTLQQYVGRLHRLHEQKTVVKVFDYVDQKEPLLHAMFEKRLKGYRSMGYQVFDGKSPEVGAGQMRLF